jgi:hypothetical protein
VPANRPAVPPNRHEIDTDTAPFRGYALGVGGGTTPHPWVGEPFRLRPDRPWPFDSGAIESDQPEPMPYSRSVSFRLSFRSVDSLRQPMISAHESWYVPAGNSRGRVPGTTTAPGGT